MDPFVKGQQVMSKQSGMRGFIDKVEFDEFFRCKMYRVDMQGNVVHLEGGKRNDGCYYWYKASDIVTPADYSKTHPVNV